MKTIPLTQGKTALVDDCDYEVLCQYKWHAMRVKCTWYARRSARGARPLMHQMLLPGGREIDHVNGDGLDNRRENLRAVSPSQNRMNQRKHAGRSRFKGVCWNTQKQKWEAQIHMPKGTAGYPFKHWLGSYSDEEAAAHAYDDAARRFFGEFAAVNFPGQGERCAIAEARQVLP